MGKKLRTHTHTHTHPARNTNFVEENAIFVCIVDDFGTKSNVFKITICSPIRLLRMAISMKRRNAYRNKQSDEGGSNITLTRIYFTRICI